MLTVTSKGTCTFSTARLGPERQIYATENSETLMPIYLWLKCAPHTNNKKQYVLDKQTSAGIYKQQKTDTRT